MNLGPSLVADALAAPATKPTHPVLVSVFLDGGMDSLSMLAPVADPVYRRLRPTLARSPGSGPVFADDPRLHWHPSAESFCKLHEAGKLAVAPSIGYSDPNQSHFTSRHYWEVGDTDAALRTGWLGRYLDIVGSTDNPLQGLSIDHTLAPALAPERMPVASLVSARSFRFEQRDVWGDVDAESVRAIEAIGHANLHNADPGARAAAATAVSSMNLRRQLLPLDEPVGSGAPSMYPAGTLGEQLSSIAAMLAIGLPLRCVAVRTGSFDTHASQDLAFTNDLKTVADCLLAFQTDLDTRGLANRVLTEVWSEFGRRPSENASAGTDHGAAGTAMLIGSRVRRQLLGEFSGLTALDSDGNMRPSLDFRGLHAAILDQWFDVDAAQVLPDARSFSTPKILD
ncbi:MAG: DUF1501 domain-containing protein [Solirubrobacterales bacterium]